MMTLTGLRHHKLKLELEPTRFEFKRWRNTQSHSKFGALTRNLVFLVSLRRITPVLLSSS